MKYSGHYYHYSEKDLASLDPFTFFSSLSSVPSDEIELIGMFSSGAKVFLPQNYLIFCMWFIYVVVGQLFIVFWCFNAVQNNSFLKSSERLLGEMKITSEKDLDSVIELIVNKYNLEQKKKSWIMKIFEYIYLFTFGISFKLLWFIPNILNQMRRGNYERRGCCYYLRQYKKEQIDAEETYIFTRQKGNHAMPEVDAEKAKVQQQNSDVIYCTLGDLVEEHSFASSSLGAKNTYGKVAMFFRGKFLFIEQLNM